MATIDGTPGDDTLDGTVDADQISGLDGNDTLNGFGGDDFLDGGNGNDQLNGGAGDDILSDEAGSNLLNGGDGNDTLDVFDESGLAVTNVMDAGAGDDRISSFSNNAASVSTVTGGSGRDTYIFSPSSIGQILVTDFAAGAGGDVLTISRLINTSGYTDGNPFDPELGYLRLEQQGADTLLQWDSTGVVGGANWRTVITLQNIDASTLTAENFSAAAPPDGSSVGFSINGTAVADTLTGSLVNDQINGLAGDDTLNGLGGIDRLRGGDGNDLIYGGTGDDTLEGGNGDDFLNGDEGNDRLFGEAGSNVLNGDEGNDLLTVFDSSGSVVTNTMDAGNGDDTIFSFSNNAESLTTVTGGGGRDSYNLISTSSGQFLVTDFAAGAGGDVLRIDELLTSSSGYSGGNPFDPALGYLRLLQQGADALLQWEPSGVLGGANWRTIITLQNTDTSTLTAENFEPVAAPDGSSVGLTIDGTSASDTLNGSVGDDQINGLDGDDMLNGFSGNDQLNGGAGFDQLFGGLGNDTLLAGTDSDGSRLFGEDGDDTLIGSGGSDVLLGGNGDDQLDGGAGDDVLRGNDGNDQLDGGAGDDELYAGSGNNQLDGGAGNDSLEGGSGNDQLDGGAGDDFLFDVEGINVLRGGDGNDRFVAGGSSNVDAGAGDDGVFFSSGNVLVTGGSGRDTYNLNPTSTGQLLVTDFAAGVGGDVLSINNLLTSSSGYSGGNPFGPALGYLRLLQEGADALLQWNSSGVTSGANWRSVITLQNTNASAITADNFAPSDNITNIVVVTLNSPPTLATAIADQSANEDAAFSFTVPAGTFTDPDASDTLTYSARLANGDPLPSWLSFDAATRSFSGTPVQANLGAIDLRVTATDSNGATASDVFRLTVNNVNDAPVLTGTPATPPAGTEDTAYAINATALLQGFTDGDGDTLSVANLSASTGTLTNNNNGTWTFTPGANVNGPVSLSYNVVDGQGGSVAANQSFNLAAVNDLPVALNDSATTRLNTAVNIAVRANDSDVDSGTVLTVTAVTQPTNGSVAINPATGNPVYTPRAAFVGTDSFSYTVSDGNGGTATATVAVTVNATAGADTINATNGADTIDGLGGNDVINGLDGDDVLLGGTGDDTLDGGSGNDTLTGGAGLDTQNGGLGNDNFRVAGTELTGDTLNGSDGTDTLQFTGAVSLAGGFALAAVEQLDMGGFALNVNTTAAVDLSALTRVGTAGSITGSSAANIISGTRSDDLIDGGAGDDTLSGGDGIDTLTGGTGNDVLNGGAGDDILVGGAGTDTQDGGTGNDSIRVAGGDLTGDNINGGTGTDTLQFTGAVNLAGSFGLVGVEQLDMGGFALNVNTTTAVDLSALTQIGSRGSIVGNATANTITGTLSDDLIDGGGDNDTLSGADGADTLIGGAGNDTLRGGAGNDVLVGGAGTDTQDGDAGDDTFRVAAGDLTGDTINGGTGTDTLQFTGAVNLAGGFGLVGVEQLDMGGFALNVTTTTAVDLSALTRVGTRGSIIGNSAANIITGTRSDDLIDGGAGNDTLSGGDGGDTLIGGTGNDVLNAGAGNDILVGGAGTDTQDGGLGNDSFRVAGNDLTGDTLTGADGIDTLQFTGAVNLAGSFGSAGVEQLDMDGFALNINTTTAVDLSSLTQVGTRGLILGNATANTVTGTSSDDRIDGGAGNDILNGNLGQDTIAGGAGNDTISGGTGADVIAGGLGNDTLYGNDALLGDGEADIFVFNTTPNGTNNRDTIVRFEAGTATTSVDRIALDPAVYSALLGGLTTGLDSTEFRGNAGGTAADANDFILYDTATGNLFYDADGSGTAFAKVLFGTLTQATGTVDYTDFTTALPPGP